MSPRKRPAAADEPAPSQLPNKRPRRLAVSVPHALTDVVYNEFRSRSGFDLSRPQFVGLCGCLYTILTWGYTITTAQLDAFILGLSTYQCIIEQFYTSETEATNLNIPSYHQWFSQHSPRGLDDVQTAVLTEARLRCIGRENPFDFICAEVTLECFAEANMGDVLAKDWDAALASLPGMGSTQRPEQM